MNTSMRSVGATLPLTTLLDTRHLLVDMPKPQRIGTGPWMGPFRGTNRGQGLDFDDLRPYVDFDDIRHIDWNVTARYNSLHTRLYREEKDNIVTLALDFRSSMYTGSSELRAVQAGKIAAALLWKITHSGSRCAVIALTDDGTQSIRALGGERGALAGCGFIAQQFELARLGSAQKPYKEPELNSGIQPLITQLLEGGRLIGGIVLISGFDRATAHLKESLQLLGARSTRTRHVCAVHIIDRLECVGVPAGLYSYNGSTKSTRIQLNQRQSMVLKSTLEQQRNELHTALKQAHINFADTEKGVAHCLSQLLNLGWLA